MRLVWFYKILKYGLIQQSELFFIDLLKNSSKSNN